MPTILPPDFRDLLSAFADEGVEYLLVGGYAVAFHAEPRATKDMDLWIAGSSENVERVFRALARFGAPAHVLEALRTQGPDEFIFFGRPPIRIDLLRSIPGVEFDDAWPHRVATLWHDVPVLVIGRDDLIAAKRASGRPRDLEDADLVESFRPDET
jgi:hypothetical protein